MKSKWLARPPDTSPHYFLHMADPAAESDSPTAAADVAKMKRQNKVLKLAVREEQAKTKALQDQLRASQIDVAGAQEEVMSLRDNRGSLVKRVATLQAELAADKSTGSSWSLPGVTGWGSSMSKSDAEKMQAKHDTMEEQLMLQIQQSQEVHEKNFELTAERDTLASRLPKQAKEHASKLAALEARHKEELLTASLRADRLLAERDEAATRADVVEARADSLEQQLGALQTEHRATLRSAETEQASLHRTIEQAEREMERVQAALSQAQKALSSEELESRR